MSQQSQDNPKRRPPVEKSTGSQQDADWGFEPAEANAAIEKKLALVLFTCLLAGFGFVFAQKLRLLEDEPLESAAAENSTSTPTQEDESFDSSGGNSVDLASFDEDASETTTNSVDAAQSPFYASASTSSPSPEVPPWTLNETPTPDADATDVPFSLGESQPSDTEGTGESFDPFSQPEDEPPASEPAAVESGADPAPSPESPWEEDSPSRNLHQFGSADSLVDVPQSNAHDASNLAVDPFEIEPPAPVDVDHDPPAVDGEDMLLFSTNDQAAPKEVEPSPVARNEQPQPMELPAPEAARVSPDLPLELNPVDNPPSAGTFDPFPPQSPPESDEPPEVQDSQFPFLAPPDPSQTVDTRATNDAPPSDDVVAPPAWPFAENDANDQPPATLEFNPAPDLPAVPAEELRLDPAPTLVAGDEPGAPVQQAPHPFAVDVESSRPIFTSQPSSQSVVGEREIVVTPSDSFWSISQEEYGSSKYFTALSKYNQDRVSKPESLRTGMKIRIPPPEVLERQFPELFRSESSQPGSITPINATSMPALRPGLFLGAQHQAYYRVGQHDTLSSIAQQHLGRSSRWTEIYDLNRDQLTSPATLTIGMELKLPADAGVSGVSPAGGFGR